MGKGYQVYSLLSLKGSGYLCWGWWYCSPFPLPLFSLPLSPPVVARQVVDQTSVPGIPLCALIRISGTTHKICVHSCNSLAKPQRRGQGLACMGVRMCYKV